MSFSPLHTKSPIDFDWDYKGDYKKNNIMVTWPTRQPALNNTHYSYFLLRCALSFLHCFGACVRQIMPFIYFFDSCFDTEFVWTMDNSNVSSDLWHSQAGTEDCATFHKAFHKSRTGNDLWQFQHFMKTAKCTDKLAVICTHKGAILVLRMCALLYAVCTLRQPKFNLKNQNF